MDQYAKELLIDPDIVKELGKMILEKVKFIEQLRRFNAY